MRFHLEPLRTLTRKDIPWASTKKCEKAFTDVKKQLQLTGTPVLVYFNPDLELTLHISAKMVLSSCRTENILSMHVDHSPQRNENGFRLKRIHYISYLDSKDLISIPTAERSSLKMITSPYLEPIIRKPLSAVPRRL